jgi:hypothetical protein
MIQMEDLLYTTSVAKEEGLRVANSRNSDNSRKQLAQPLNWTEHPCGIQQKSLISEGHCHFGAAS